MSTGGFKPAYGPICAPSNLDRCELDEGVVVSLEFVYRAAMRRDCLILLKNLSTKLRAHHVGVDTIKIPCPGPGSPPK